MKQRHAIAFGLFVVGCVLATAIFVYVKERRTAHVFTFRNPMNNGFSSLPGTHIDVTLIERRPDPRDTQSRTIAERIFVIHDHSTVDREGEYIKCELELLVTSAEASTLEDAHRLGELHFSFRKLEDARPFWERWWYGEPKRKISGKQIFGVK